MHSSIESCCAYPAPSDFQVDFDTDSSKSFSGKNLANGPCSFVSDECSLFAGSNSTTFGMPAWREDPTFKEYGDPPAKTHEDTLPLPTIRPSDDAQSRERRKHRHHINGLNLVRKNPGAHVGLGGHLSITCETPQTTAVGDIQGYGSVIGLTEDTKGNFLVSVASDNSESILGYTPSQLFALESFTHILRADDVSTLLQRINSISKDGPNSGSPEVSSIAIETPDGLTNDFLCVIHADANNPHILLCEFEPREDNLTNCNMTRRIVMRRNYRQDYQRLEVQAKSGGSRIVDAPVLEHRNSHRTRGSKPLEMLDFISKVQERFASASTLETLIRYLVETLKTSTKHHDVMVHRFDKDWNKRLIAQTIHEEPYQFFQEARDSTSKELSRENQEMYEHSTVHVLFDRNQKLARLLHRPHATIEAPLDSKSLYLRTSPKSAIRHSDDNVVQTSTTVPLKVFGKVWGVVTCNSHAPSRNSVSFFTRGLCRLIADSATREIEKMTTSSLLEARGPMIPHSELLKQTTFKFATPQDLLRMFVADFAILSSNNEHEILGSARSTQESLVLMEYLRSSRLTDILATFDLSADLPDLQDAAGFQTVEGVLFIPLSAPTNGFMAFVRETKTTMSPHAERQWSEKDIQNAAIIRVVLSKFHSIWRQKEEALYSSHLSGLLISNSGHEFRTLLNAIMNYLDFAVESHSGLEANHVLVLAQVALKSLLSTVPKLLEIVDEVRW